MKTEENKPEPQNLKVVFFLTVSLAITFCIYILMFLRFPAGLVELFFLSALIALAYFARRGNSKAYKVLRVAFWFIWVVSATLLAIFLIITKGDFQSMMSTKSTSAALELKRIGIGLMATFAMRAITFGVSALSYF